VHGPEGRHAAPAPLLPSQPAWRNASLRRAHHAARDHEGGVVCSFLQCPRRRNASRTPMRWTPASRTRCGSRWPPHGGEACLDALRCHTAQVGTVGRGSQDRGDYFYKTGNYKAAINAYTASLQVGRCCRTVPIVPAPSRAEPSDAALASALACEALSVVADRSGFLRVHLQPICQPPCSARLCSCDRR
jgi:hypothetical protein